MRTKIYTTQIFFFCLFLFNFNLKATDTVRVEKVFQTDWAAYVHFPPSEEKLPVIITLGGAEGGLSFTRNEADLMAKEGFIIMRFGYFKYTSATQGQILKEIRIEKVLEAIEFIKKSHLADSSRIGLLGVSKGAELALLVASVTSSVKAVAAHVPSHVVWYGLGKKRGLNKSSWTWKGAPLAFMPYAKPKSGWFTKRIAEFYEAGLAAYPEQIEAAMIRVETISGPVLLTSGGKDDIWPSNFMALELKNRFDKTKFPYAVKHLDFPDAGHGLFGLIPAENDAASMDALASGGGSSMANYRARKETWQETFSFFRLAFTN